MVAFVVYFYAFGNIGSWPLHQSTQLLKITVNNISWKNYIIVSLPGVSWVFCENSVLLNWFLGDLGPHVVDHSIRVLNFIRSECSNSGVDITWLGHPQLLQEYWETILFFFIDYFASVTSGSWPLHQSAQPLKVRVLNFLRWNIIIRSPAAITWVLCEYLDHLCWFLCPLGHKEDDHSTKVLKFWRWECSTSLGEMT